MTTLIFLNHGQEHSDGDQPRLRQVLSATGQAQASSAGALLRTHLGRLTIHNVLLSPARCTIETFVYASESGLKDIRPNRQIKEDRRLLPFLPLKNEPDATQLETDAAERRYWELGDPNHQLDGNQLNESFTDFVERVDDVVREAFARTTDTLCVTSWDVIALALFRQIHPTAHVPPAFMRSYLDYRDMTRLPYGGSIGIKPRRKT